jgi:hypothetical protein
MKVKLTKKIFLTSIGIASATVPFISTSCVYPSDFHSIPITDSNLVFSQNNWLQTKNEKGRDVMTTYPGGAYIKVAFLGNTIGIDTYCTSSFPKRVSFACYIDGAKEPIVKSLSKALGNLLIFADNLKPLANDKPHTAKICVRYIQPENEKQNRFN